MHIRISASIDNNMDLEDEEMMLDGGKSNQEWCLADGDSAAVPDMIVARGKVPFCTFIDAILQLPDPPTAAVVVFSTLS